MSRAIQFTVLGTPAPQGSLRKAGKFLKCDNPATMPYRQAVGWAALNSRTAARVHEIWAARHEPIALRAEFWFAPPLKMPKGRTRPAVKPDIDKLCRSVCDAITGILLVDDGQIVELTAKKMYGTPARTEIELAALK